MKERKGGWFCANVCVRVCVCVYIMCAMLYIGSKLIPLVYFNIFSKRSNSIKRSCDK